MPLITTKRVYWKTATREMLWFLTGETNIRPLVLQGVNIWNEWPHASYLRATGKDTSLEDFIARIAADEHFAVQWGDLGPVYGKQWVDWTTYEQNGDGSYRKGEGINQVAQVIESLENQSRQPSPHHRGLERRRTRPDGAAAVPQDLPVPCRWGPAQLPALPAQLRRRAGPAVQPVVRRAAPADDRAAGRAGAGRTGRGWAEIRISISTTAELVEEQLGRDALGRAAAGNPPQAGDDIRLPDRGFRGA